MFDKVYNLIKNKDFSIPQLLLLNYKDLKITDQELIILIYLINSDNIYNPKNIGNDLKLELVDVLTNISNLAEKGLLNISIVDKNGKKAELVDLKPLYDKLSFLIINEEQEQDSTIYSTIEKEFGRPLSPLEYELINAWLDASYSEEIINEALKEAIYNNVTSLKYIDKILDDWHKKGIKTKEDVLNNKKKFKERKSVKSDSFDYDWLNEE